MAKVADSLLCKVVVVRIDSTTKLSCLQESLPANLVIPVVRYVELIETGVRLREPGFVQVVHESHLVLSRDLAQVSWQSVPTPNELQVQCTFLPRETLKDAPEPLDELVVRLAVRVDSDRFQAVCFDEFGATGSYFDRLMGEVRDVAQIAVENSVHSCLYRFVLLIGLRKSCFYHKIDELINVLLSHFAAMAIGGQADLLSV